MSSSTLTRVLSDAPDDYGLLITIDMNDEETSSCCQMQFVPDEHFGYIHPNAYGPTMLTDLEVLGGGGSGVRVFKGSSPQFGHVVMKHGGYKDTKELFALATIAHELQARTPQDAREDMKWRLPEYRMLYISPCHLRETPKEAWKFLTKALGFFIHPAERNDSSSGDTNHTWTSDESSHYQDSLDGDASTHHERTVGRDIRLYTTSSTPESNVHVSLNSARLKIVLGSHEMVQEDDYGLSFRYGNYDTVKTFLDKLLPYQKKRMWKFTQGQKTIGSPTAKTGVSYLSNGTLCGDILDTLIREYVQVIHNLQALTTKQETLGVKLVREEAKKAANDCYMRPYDISNEADAFVGFAIKKNFHPDTGRFFQLRRFGNAFRSNSLTLTKEEKFPARLLGIVLKPKARMSHAFVDAPDVPTALDTKGIKLDTWRVLLQDAVSIKTKAATKCIWSCGIADGGLHNLFLDADKMWLFDLGEPCYQPLPAFLTKFLFSFFHGLGMVDDKENGGWVNRFVPAGKKVALTDETKFLTGKAYYAFKVTVDRLIHVLFEANQAVRGLLINYVTLQLLSDAGFCLDRWVTKGGGKARNGNHNKQLEKWLWRALWDIYIASDLNTRKRLKYVGANVHVEHDNKSIHGPAM